MASVDFREAVETLILMRDVLKDMTWHRRIAKKLTIAGDIGKIKFLVGDKKLDAVYGEDAAAARTAVFDLDSAVMADNYILSRKKLEVAIKSVARLIADDEIGKWRPKED